MMLKFLHINDNSMYKKKGEPGHDSLFKIRPFLEQLFHNFQAAYTLHREISVDETMISYKGRIGFIQYMPKKPKKWGLKAFALSDAHSGYVYNWHLYTGKFSMLCVCERVCYHYLTSIGKDDSIGNMDNGMTHAVVMKLADSLKNRGHHVYTDNFYTSPALFADLRSKGFGACGTLRMNRRGIPPAIKPTIEKGTTKVVNVDDSMLVIKWSDKREVTVLTTIHQAGFVGVERRNRHAPGGRENVEKPIAIVEYNHYMGGVDRGDQLLSYYGFAHRTRKWWRRVFFFLLDTAVVNSYILYTEEHPNKKKRMTHEQFRIELANNLLSLAGDDTTTPSSSQGPQAEPLPSSLRLTERHFPTNIGKTASSRLIQRDCTVCSQRKGRG